MYRASIADLDGSLAVRLICLAYLSDFNGTYLYKGQFLKTKSGTSLVAQ